MSQINQILNNDWLSNAETLFTKNSIRTSFELSSD